MSVFRVVSVVAALLYPLVFTAPFPQHVMIMVFVFAALGEAWNILGGLAGQTSLGHAAFFGIGAYTSTMLLTQWGASPWVGMAAGMILAASLLCQLDMVASGFTATTWLLPHPLSALLRSRLR